MQELHAGDIGAIAKLKETITGRNAGRQGFTDFLCARAIAGAFDHLCGGAEDARGRRQDRRGDSQNHGGGSGAAVSRAIRRRRNFCWPATGQQHIEVVVAKLQKRYNVDLTLKPPKVPYRETIRGKADAEGKHKKQSGGHGQFGVCRMKIEPMERGKGIEFVDDVFGGAIPENWIPSVERGIREAAARGYLAGFPVVDFRAILYDGKYHDVDSSDIAFKIAGFAGLQGSDETGEAGVARAGHAGRGVCARISIRET